MKSDVVRLHAVIQCFSFLFRPQPCSFQRNLSVSYLNSFRLSSSPSYMLCVKVREKVRGIFPQICKTRPNPQQPHTNTHTHTYFLSVPTLSVSCQEGRLEENHPYSTTESAGCLLELYSPHCSVHINCELPRQRYTGRKYCYIRVKAFSFIEYLL